MSNLRRCVVGLVAVLVPLIALAWLVIQNREGAPLADTGQRVRDYVLRELPGYRGELVLLMMAGYIGTIGSRLLGPLMVQGDHGPVGYRNIRLKEI